jgi:hypothetical protein
MHLVALNRFSTLKVRTCFCQLKMTKILVQETTIPGDIKWVLNTFDKVGKHIFHRVPVSQFRILGIQPLNTPRLFFVSPFTIGAKPSRNFFLLHIHTKFLNI